jgi:hypothetical protein
LLEFDLFFAPPEFFQQNKVLQQFCTSIFCQNPGIFQKNFFVPSKTSAFWQKVWRILLEKGENQKVLKKFACEPWFWALSGKKVLEFKHFFHPPQKFCKFLLFIAFLNINFWTFGCKIKKKKFPP